MKNLRRLFDKYAIACTEHGALVKSTTKIFSNFVTFSENPNFTRNRLNEFECNYCKAFFMNSKNQFLKNLYSGTQCGGFQFLLILDLWGVSFHAVVLFSAKKEVIVLDYRSKYRPSKFIYVIRGSSFKSF
jgi:hypothetical protein